MFSFKAAAVTQQWKQHFSSHLHFCCQHRPYRKSSSCYFRDRHYTNRTYQTCDRHLCEYTRDGRFICLQMYNIICHVNTLLIVTVNPHHIVLLFRTLFFCVWLLDSTERTFAPVDCRFVLLCCPTFLKSFASKIPVLLNHASYHSCIINLFSIMPGPLTSTIGCNLRSRKSLSFRYVPHGWLSILIVVSYCSIRPFQKSNVIKWCF